MSPVEELVQLPKKRDPRALNAYRHGLTGQVQLISPADQVAYDIHCKGVVKHIGPGDEFETSLAQTVADDLWRLQRAAAMESTHVTDGIDRIPNCHEHDQIDIALAQCRVWMQDAKNIVLYTLYERRIQGKMQRNLKLIQDSQAARQAALEKAAYEANLLAQLAKAKGENFNIERDYPREAIPPQFDFSTSEIARLARHIALLEEAKRRFPAPKIPARKAA